MTTILQRVKEAVTGFSVNDQSFDSDIITAINTIFLYLYQQNVGDNIFIINQNTTWDDFLKTITIYKDVNDIKNLSLLDVSSLTIEQLCYATCATLVPMLEQYIILKTKLLFDPPANDALQKAINNAIGEIEYRINIEFNDYKRGD